MGRVVSVNVGTPRRIEVGGRAFETGIFKEPVEGSRLVADDHVDGDQQADPSVHGGPEKAVYAYASEDTAWWAHELGRDDLGPGTWGENLTLAGVDVSGAVLGATWQVGGAILRVTEPRVPCFKLAAKMGDPRFAHRFGRAGRPGAYLGIGEPGEVAAGDRVDVLDVPSHGVTVVDVFDAYHRVHDEDAAARRARLEALQACPDLSSAGHAWLAHELGDG